MQTMSHKTRAYFFYACGLKGFLARGTISILKQAELNGEIRAVTRYQHICLSEIVEELSSMLDFDERIEYLGQHYPCLCIFVLKKRGMDKALKKYMEDCKLYENDHEKYSLYVHGWFLPWI